MNGLGGLLLAAGEGSRHGGPKALARHGGRPWVVIGVETLRVAGIDEIAVVLGSMADSVRPHLSTHDVRIVEHPGWRLGRTGSVQAGLRSLSRAARGVLIHQVDFPFVGAGTIAALARAFLTSTVPEERIVLPVHDGRRGHPIIIGRALWPEIAALGPDEPLRVVIHRDPTRVEEVTVPDRGIHRNLNTPLPEEA